MGKKRNLFIPVIVVILLIAVAFWLVKLKPTDTASSDVDEMVQRVENALGDDFKKQSKTEVAATLVYGNGEEDANINYHKPLNFRLSYHLLKSSHLLMTRYLQFSFVYQDQGNVQHISSTLAGAVQLPLFQLLCHPFHPENLKWSCNNTQTLNHVLP